MANNLLSTIINLLVSVGAIPFIVTQMKKLLPKLGRYAPVAVVILAAVYVIVGNMIGLNLDLTDTITKILLILGLAGGSTLTYDVLKTTIRGE